MKLNKTAFYFLSFTWGLPLTLIGCLVAGILWCFGYRPKKYVYGYCIEIGRNWGGLELGVFFLTDKNSSMIIKDHELGHGIQNCIYGIFMIPLVCIPSAVRYWYREIIWRINRNKYWQLPDYYSIWFEKQASEWGRKIRIETSQKG